MTNVLTAIATGSVALTGVTVTYDASAKEFTLNLPKGCAGTASTFTVDLEVWGNCLMGPADTWIS
jgi:hypothetical protein